MSKTLPEARAVAAIVELMARTAGPESRALGDVLTVVSAARYYMRWIDALPIEAGADGGLILAQLRSAVGRLEGR